jgi:hypothetical protein
MIIIFIIIYLNYHFRVIIILLYHYYLFIYLIIIWGMTKGKGKQQNQVAVSAETQMTRFIAKFEKDFSLVSCLSTNMILMNAWYVNNGASRHMTLMWQLFSTLKKQDSRARLLGAGSADFQKSSGAGAFFI